MSTKDDGHVKRFMTATRGSGLPIGLFLGGCACFAFTVLMNRAFGASIGATDEGKYLLSGATITIDIVGLGVFGLAAGSLASSTRHWMTRLVAIPIFVVVLACALNSIMSNLNFVASQRLAITKAREAHEAAIKDRRQEAEQARKERLRIAEEDTKARRDAQERLVNKQLGFMQAEVKDASGRERKVLRKDFAGEAAKIIAEVGKGGPTAAEPETKPAAEMPIVIVQPEGGAEIIATITGLEEKMLRLAQMAYIAILLTVLKTCSFPLAGFFWAERKGVAIKQAPVVKDADQGAAPPAAPITLVAESAPLALSGPAPAMPASAPPAIAPETAPAAPQIAAVKTLPPGPAKAAPAPRPDPNPFLDRTPVAGSEVELRALGFPVDARPAGPQRPKDAPKISAKRFARVAKAYEQTGSFWSDDCQALYHQFCVADHREPTNWRDFSEALKSTQGIDFAKKRTGTLNDNKAAHYTITPGRYSKPKEPANDVAPSSAPAPQEVGTAGKSPFDFLAVVANDAAPMKPVANRINAPRAPAFVLEQERWGMAVSRAIKADSRGLSRKQRGARVNRMARLAA